MDPQSRETRNLTRERIVNGHIGKTVWWLAWPSVITMLLQTVNGLIDTAFVGQLGASQLSGVGLASQVFLILMAIAASVGVGTTALVARFIGANHPEEAEKTIRQSILIGVAVSIVTGVPVFLLGPILIQAMGGTGEDLGYGLTYLNILILGTIPFYLMFALTGVFRGMGDMRTPLWAMGAATVVNVLGDYFLIFGIGPFPELGVAGAGVANVTSRTVAAVLLAVYLGRSTLGRCFSGCWQPEWVWFRRVLNIGAPVAVQGLMRTGASMAFFGILGLTPEATFAIAALTIGLRTEAIAFMPGFAFSVAATSMVGQNLGALKPERAEQGAWAAAWQGIAVMGTIGVIFVLFGHQIASVFTDDPEVIRLAGLYLQINGVAEPFLALAMVLTGALQGAGETRLPTVATIVTLWFIRLPLTYYLTITLGYGATGAWVAMAGSTVLGGLVTLAIFKWSRWQQKNV